MKPLMAARQSDVARLTRFTPAASSSATLKDLPLMPAMKLKGFESEAHTFRTDCRSGSPGAMRTSAPAFSNACRRRMVSSRSGRLRTKFSVRAVSTSFLTRAAAATRSTACSKSYTRSFVASSIEQPARPISAARRTVSAASRGSSAKQRSRSAETGSSVASTIARACSSASSRVTMPSRLPSVPACAPLDVASAWKPRPARTRAEPASQAFAMTKQRACSALNVSALADGRGIHQPALVPQAVQPALEAERLKVGVEALTVVAHLLDDVERPLIVDAEHLADVAARADEALNGRVGARGFLVDVLGADAHFLGFEHGEHRPLHDVEPAVVAVPHGRSERLFRDDFRQDDVLFGLRCTRGARRDETRVVGGVNVAAAGEVGVQHLFHLLNDDRLEVHLVRAEVVGEVELGRRAGLHADSGTVQLLRALHVELAMHHEALAVVVVHADKVQAEARIARDGPGGVARENVDFARLKRGEALLRRERRVAHLVRVAEHRGRDRAAKIDVKAFPDALGIGLRESGEAGVHAALHVTLGADRVERGLLRERGCCEDC